MEEQQSHTTVSVKHWQELLNTEIIRGLAGRDFLSLRDFTPGQIEALIDLALALKQARSRGEPHPILGGRSLAMIFRKPSTRTRVAFEVGMTELGGHALYLSANEIQLHRGESLPDTARVLSRMVHGIVIRTFRQEEVEEMARYASVPVINGLTDLFHPTQVLADLVTLREKWGSLRGHRLAYVGDGNNMTHSLMFGAALMGMEMVVATPAEHGPDPAVLAEARQLAARYGGRVEWVQDPREAVKGAEAVYTDTWVSMGQEGAGEEVEAKRARLRPYQVNTALLDLAAPGALVMHCLPAHRGEEATDDVLDGPTSVIFDQAENRLHAHKAILAACLR
ncbi:MAG: ornithine carbamoyltransferase [Limnochordales bacterium]|nr:ornithine carbamoyltransferase [Limnochordales bacterium]